MILQCTACLLLIVALASVTTAQFARKASTPYSGLHQAQESRQNWRQFEVLPESDRMADTEKKPIKATATTDSASGTEAHSRTKRMIWITDDGRLALPPGTVLSISPTISLPLVRYPPSGFLSNMTMSFPLTIDFDKLGLTDNENPLGVLPPVFGRSMGSMAGRAAGSMLSHYVGQYLHIRRKRETTHVDGDHHGDQQQTEMPAALPVEHQHVFHGGERAILYGVVEDMIATFGFNGKACMLRAICEMHSKSVHQYGLFGEMAKLFFTASKSKYSDMLPEYVQAQRVGEGSSGPGECFPYYKDCPRSIFRAKAPNRYSESTADDEHTSEDHRSHDLDAEQVVHLEDNEISDINGMDERFNM